MKDYDFLIFIGRFQPVHKGHLHVIHTALTRAQQVIVLCGSAHQPRSLRNPWTVPERIAMMRSALNEEQNARVHIVPLMDVVYNDESWVANVQGTVNGLVTAHHNTPHRKAKIGLIGHSKDHSSYYLNLFPQWGAVEVENLQEISATPIREALFNQGKIFPRGDSAKRLLPQSVSEQLHQFCESEDYHNIREEYEFIAKYRSAWKSAPYAPVFVTVDAVVVQSGHVLLVERKARPGRGLLALPGGFVNPKEKLVDACLRELREETRLKVPLPVVKGSIKQQRVFDDPNRSQRGRTITHAFYIEFEPNAALPKVKGGDDAQHAAWVPLAELNPAQLYEDHYFIIQEMIGM